MSDGAHVPAWKRLGLKLKYAKDESPSSASTTPESKKRKSHTEDVAPEPAAAPANTPTPKKRKTKIEENGGSETPLRSLQKRKSVTFTPETKKQDGDSAKEIIRQWEEQYYTDMAEAANNARLESEKSSTSTTSTPADDTATEPSKPIEPAVPTPPAKKPPKKPKQKKSAKKSKSTPVSNEPHPAIAYLSTFSTHRTQWKFQKSKDIYILKHALSIADIPSEVNKALFEYISSVKAPGARQRLNTAAREVIDKDEGRLEKQRGVGDEDELVKKQQKTYRKAVVGCKKAVLENGANGDLEEIDLSDADKKCLESRCRAELMYEAVKDDVAEAPKAVGAQKKTEDTSDGKRKRKDRVRTVVVESDTSSSESENEDDETSSSGSSDSDSDSDSSSSDSDSDSDSGTPAKPKKAVSKSKRSTKDKASADSSPSDSSSGSDSDADSESSSSAEDDSSESDSDSD